MAGPRLIEWADPARAEVLLRGANVQPILARKRHLVEIQLLDYGDCSRVPAKEGYPQKLTTDLESDVNPPHVHTFKRLPVVRSCAPSDRQYIGG
jgi:hypothetical protein